MTLQLSPKSLTNVLAYHVTREDGTKFSLTVGPTTILLTADEAEKLADYLRS